MKLRTFIFALVASSLIAALFASEPPVHRDHYGHETLEALKETGIIKLNGTCITNDLQLSGSLIAQGATIGTLDIMGQANLTNTTVKKGGIVLGSLQAVGSTFESPITILAQKAVFTTSKLEGITIQKDNGFKGKQIVELRQGTIVKGAIHFESGKGEVLIYPGSQVLGAITGGKAVKKS